MGKSSCLTDPTIFVQKASGKKVKFIFFIYIFLIIQEDGD